MTVTKSFDENQFLSLVRAVRDPDQIHTYKGQLGMLPVTLRKLTTGEWVIHNQSAIVDEVRTVDTTKLSSDIVDSLYQLSPSSVAWLVTGKAQWSQKPELKLWASLVKRPGVLDYVQNVVAGSVGISLEPDPTLRVGLQGPEATFDILSQHVGPPESIGEWTIATCPLPIKLPQQR
jgi:hypothetical protein